VWSAKIDSFDAFIFVTAEYNHSIPGALKNAIDYLYKEWNNKAAGFVGYDSAGGVRAVEHLRLVMAELQVADVLVQVAVSIITEFENFQIFKPASYQEILVNTLLDQVISWGRAEVLSHAKMIHCQIPSIRPLEEEEIEAVKNGFEHDK
jgi:NAD(P)H-dependent FMN reductase